MDKLFNGATLGAFRILHPIGEGGMARVYKAYQPSMERYVALKVLPSSFAEDPQFVERFIREARTIAALEHRNILPVFDFGEQGGITYMAMRYVEGGTLKELLAKGRLTLHDTQDLLSQVCAALDYAHRRKVIHRDVKPSNVILDGEGAAYLMDFGIAKVVGASADLTATGAAIGTPAYMAPEQAVGGAVDGRTDIYALGVMLFEMVVGRVPFQADTPMAVLMAHLHDPLPLPSQIDPTIPETVEAVVIKALAKAPEDRYQTANDMAAGFRKALQAADVKSEASTLVTLIEEVRDSRSAPAASGFPAGAGAVTPHPTPTPDPRLRQRMEQDYIDGLSAFWIRDWPKALVCFQAVLAVDANYKDAASRLAEVEKQIRLAELYAQSQEAMQRKDWPVAHEALRQLAALDKEYQQAAAMLQTVERKLELAELAAQAEQLAQAGQWPAVVKIFERIQSLDASYPDALGLLPKARQAIAEQQRLDKVKQTYQRGLQALEEGKWKEAQKLFEQVKSQQPGFGDTALLLQRVQDEISRTRARKPALSTFVPQSKPVSKPTSPLNLPAQPAAEQTVAAVKPAARRRTWIWVVAVLVVLGLAAAVIGALLFPAGWLDKLVGVIGLAPASPTSTSAPQLAKVQTSISSTHQHQPDEKLLDNFDADPNGKVDPSIWSLGGNCDAFDVVGRLVQDGVVRLLNYTSDEVQRCQLWLAKGQRFIPSDLWPFEAQLYFAERPTGGEAAHWLALLADLEPGHSVQAVCGLRVDPSGRLAQTFSVWEQKGDKVTPLFNMDALALYKRWYTFRLGINPQSRAFECYSEDRLLGEFRPEIADVLRNVPFARFIESDRAPQTVARTLIDDVYLWPGGNVPAQPSSALPVSGCPVNPKGWIAEYWDNMDLQGEARGCQDVPEIKFDWGEGGPVEGIPADNFSARFSRKLEFEPGLYSFHVISDDGVRLFVDGTKYIDAWETQGSVEHAAKVKLDGGVHKVVVEYFESTGWAGLSMEFSGLPILQDCLPPPPGIVGWWSGDGDAGNEFGGPEGVMNGPVSYMDGMVAQAFRFENIPGQAQDGVFIDIPSILEFKELKVYTIDSWVYLNPNVEHLEFIEEFVVMPDTLLLRKSGSGELELVMFINGVDRIITSPMRLPVGEWFHVAATYDGRIMRLFLNGRPVAEAEAPGQPGPAQHLWLSHPQETLRGSLDEVTLYGNVLSPEKIQAIYAAGAFGKCK